MPYSKSPMKKSSCIKMYDGKGKPSGLMMEGSVAYMESAAQERKNLKTKNPIVEASDIKKAPDQDIKEIKSKASAMEMSPYKLTKEEKETPTENLEGVTVTGDASKVGAYGKELDTIFSSIQSTLDKGGYSSSRAQKEAGLGYGTSASKEFGRLQQMREKEGVIPTLRYIKRRSRG